jgi:hypothetical protein
MFFGRARARKAIIEVGNSDVVKLLLEDGRIEKSEPNSDELQGEELGPDCAIMQLVLLLFLEL